MNLPLITNRLAAVLDAKSRALCYGFWMDRAAREATWGTETIDDTFIHGTVYNVQGIGTVNTILTDEFSRAHDSVRLSTDASGAVFASFGWGPVAVVPLKQPACLRKHRVAGAALCDIMRLHTPTTIFLTPVRECIFGTIGQGCQFCTFGMGRPVSTAIDDVVRGLDLVFAELGQVCDVAIGGGTPNVHDFGARYYADMVKAITGRWPVRVSVEIVPPSRACLEHLIDSGASALIMSIEIWNDKSRRELCPGKSRVSKDDYLRAWSDGVTLLGAGQVASVLLVGLDSEISIAEAVTDMVGRGVLPTLIPFRPYGSCAMQTHRWTSHEEYLRISARAARVVHDAGLRSSRQPGCTACGACSLDVALELSSTGLSPGDIPPSM